MRVCERGKRERDSYYCEKNDARIETVWRVQSVECGDKEGIE
jgi:hypothetical protein